jgi:cyd operon protein YbgT
MFKLSHTREVAVAGAFSILNAMWLELHETDAEGRRGRDD